MLRTESLRSCSNWTLIMRSSYQVACIPTCSRMPTFGGHTLCRSIGLHAISCLRLIPGVEAMLGPIPVIPVIGGGPAGMSCALWLRNYAVRPIIIEKEHVLGGMAERSPYPNEGLLGR